MVFGSNSCPGDIMALVQAAQISMAPAMSGPSDNNMATGGSVELGMCMTFGGTWAMDINSDSSCSRTMDPDMVLGSSPGPEVTMAQGDSIEHPDQYDLASTQPLVTT
ncbi:hypothetical protein STEG23_010720 [Scotinomys teguina]